jgi:hypothetical protein
LKLQTTKPPKAVIPQLYQNDDATIRFPTALWKDFQDALKEYEDNFGAAPTPQQVEQARTDITTWHFVGDWTYGFEQRHYRLMGRIMDHLIEAATQKGDGDAK